MSQGRPYAVTGGGIPEIYPGTLAGLCAAMERAQELSAACGPAEIRRDGTVIHWYQDGMRVTGRERARRA
jgi:hypothetical protein